jgi:O-antigen/teichoic acid export membrane protein
MSSKSPSLSTQSIAVFIGQVSGFAVNFLTPVLLVRLISKSDYGVLQQFVLMGNTLLPILGLGLASSLYYFFPVKTGSQRNSFVFNTWLQMAVSGLMFLLVFSYLGKEILELLGMEVLSSAGRLVAIYIMFLLSGTFIDFLFVLEQRVRMSMVFNPIDKTFRLLLVTGAAFFTQDVLSCLLALLIYAGLRFAFISYYVLTRYYEPSVWGSMFGNVKSQLAYSLPFAAGIIFTTLSQRVDKLLVNRYITEEEFASYSLAFFSIPLISQAFTSINNVVTPQITKFMANDQIRQAHDLYTQVVSKTSSLAFPAIVFFTIMAPELITFLFTASYLDATPYYRAYLLMFLFTMTSYGIGLRAAKKTKLIMLSNFIGMSITVGVGLMIIPVYRLNGAIFTALLGIGIPVLTQLFFEKSLYRSTFRTFLPWREILISLSVSLIACVPLLGIKYFDLPDLVALAIAGLVYFPIILVLERRFGIFAFESQLNKLIQTLKNKV